MTIMTMTIILVEIVRMTLDAFWSKKSTICQRNVSQFAPPVRRYIHLKWPVSVFAVEKKS